MQTGCDTPFAMLGASGFPSVDRSVRLEVLMVVTADTEAVFALLCAADPDVMGRDELTVYVK